MCTHCCDSVIVRDLQHSHCSSVFIKSSLGGLTPNGNHTQILVSLLSEEERLLAFPTTKPSNLLTNGEEKTLYSTEEHVEEQLKPIPDFCLLWVRNNTFSLQQLSEPRAHYSAPSQSQFMLHVLLQHWEKTGSKRSRWNKAFLYR